MSSLMMPVAMPAPAACAPDNAVPRTEKLLLAAIVAIFLLLAARSALLRPLWFDELSTLFVAGAPSFRHMLQALPSDGNPPLYFLLVWPLLHVPMKAELALRLPSIVGYAVGGLAIYQFVRRHCGQVFALAAFSMFLASSMQRYAIEGRPYALLLAFTGLSLCFWQAYCRTGRPNMLMGAALSVVGAVLSHQYGFLYGVLPMFAGACARGWRTRRLDPAFLLAALPGVAALAITLPPMLQRQKGLFDAIRNCPVFWAHPQFQNLKLYGDMAPAFLPAIGVVALLALLCRVFLLKASPSSEVEDCTAPIEDFVAATTLALMLPVTLIVTRAGTHYFQERYGIGSAMGLAIVTGLLLSRAARMWKGAEQLAWTATAYCLVLAVVRIWLVASAPGVAAWKDPLLQINALQEPIVVASALEFSPFWYYSDANMRARLHYLSDLKEAGQHSDPVPEYSLSLESHFTPLQLDDYQTFVGQHRNFLLYCYGEPRLEWVKQRLVREGWRLTSLGSALKMEPTVEGGKLYRELYRVSR